MKLLVISGNPKKDGLCHAIGEALKKGARDGGADVEEIRLCDMKIEACRVCGDGWGTCREQHYCSFGGDGFDDVSAKAGEADAVAFITPVYWNEVSEAMKSFMDRFRRCNFGQNGKLSGKQALIVVSAGGTGNGILPCLEQLDRFCRHTGAVIYDYIGINRWNSDYKREAVYASAKALAEGRKNGDTVSLG
jgi:multimeric flavodoxin WrbA